MIKKWATAKFAAHFVSGTCWASYSQADESKVPHGGRQRHSQWERPQLASKSLYCANQVLATARAISQVTKEICSGEPQQGNIILNEKSQGSGVLCRFTVRCLNRPESSYWDSTIHTNSFMEEVELQYCKSSHSLIMASAVKSAL